MLKLLTPFAGKKSRRTARIEPFRYPYLDHYGRMRTDHEVQGELNALRDRLEERRYRHQVRQFLRRSRWPSSYAEESREPVPTNRPSMEPTRVTGS